MARWTVIMEISLIAEARARGLLAARELLAVQRHLRQEGPDALRLDSAHLAGVPSWEQLETACRPDLFIDLGARRLWIELEIRPGCTIVFRRGRLE